MCVESAGGVMTEIECDAVLLSCGPWTSQVAKALGIKMEASIMGLKASSVLLEPGGDTHTIVDDSCLFMDW